MTNSMIPYSFIPGTKAKANEVNANFIALAETITNNKDSLSKDVEGLKETLTKLIDEELEAKADKTELIKEHTVEEAGTDLDNYKTNGTYIFKSDYTPLNVPEEAVQGILMVSGCEDSAIKQIWFDGGENKEIFTRTYENSVWSEWNSVTGKSSINSHGYLKFPNGIILQWGYWMPGDITYPLAYKTYAVPLFTKQGQSGYGAQDTFLISQSLTGISCRSTGNYKSTNYFVIGY